MNTKGHAKTDADANANVSPTENTIMQATAAPPTTITLTATRAERKSWRCGVVDECKELGKGRWRWWADGCGVMAGNGDGDNGEHGDCNCDCERGKQAGERAM